MAAARRTKAVELFWKIHLPLYRWSGGRLGGSVMGMPVLLLEPGDAWRTEPERRFDVYIEAQLWCPPPSRLR